MLESLISELLGGRLPRLVCDNEAAWKHIWLERDIGSGRPTQVAVLGGALADRLSWAFICGYQGAIRSVFPAVGSDGWASFLVTENRKQPREFPAVTLSAEGRLNGVKTWVAAAANVEHLVVKAGQGTGREFVLVNRHTEGVGIQVPKVSNFLSEMTQGSAHFDAVMVQPSHRLDAGEVETFGAREALFVQMALVAQMANHAVHHAGDIHFVDRTITWLLAADAATEFEPRGASFALSAAALDREVTGLATDFERSELPNAGDGIANWARDRRLISMYSAAIQRRAEEHGGTRASSKTRSG
ncbi:MAG: hypothetical protein K0U93_03640 [Gammaproteobacteria bacterium]|nr:hypothetical protein [Gammaproteobacteria bacterium]